jgi:hypothetical protein
MAHAYAGSLRPLLTAGPYGTDRDPITHHPAAPEKERVRLGRRDAAKNAGVLNTGLLSNCSHRLRVHIGQDIAIPRDPNIERRQKEDTHHEYGHKAADDHDGKWPL